MDPITDKRNVISSVKLCDLSDANRQEYDGMYIMLHRYYQCSNCHSRYRWVDSLGCKGLCRSNRDHLDADNEDFENWAHVSCSAAVMHCLIDQGVFNFNNINVIWPTDKDANPTTCRVVRYEAPPQ